MGDLRLLLPAAAAWITAWCAVAASDAGFDPAIVAGSIWAVAVALLAVEVVHFVVRMSVLCALTGVRWRAIGDALVLVAFGDDAGKRAAVALPGQLARPASGATVTAPLQPGQAGSPAFDRQGRLVGLVTANPSDKQLVAGIAPQRAYALADVAAIQGMLSQAGLSLPPAAAGAELSTGAVVEKVSGAVLPLVCGI